MEQQNHGVEPQKQVSVNIKNANNNRDKRTYSQIWIKKKSTILLTNQIKPKMKI